MSVLREMVDVDRYVQTTSGLSCARVTPDMSLIQTCGLVLVSECTLKLLKNNNIVKVYHIFSYLNNYHPIKIYFWPSHTLYKVFILYLKNDLISVMVSLSVTDCIIIFSRCR